GINHIYTIPNIQLVFYEKLITVCICFSVMVSISAQTPEKIQQWKAIVAKGKYTYAQLNQLDSALNYAQQAKKTIEELEGN
ncbi:MAG: hypothetical protein ACRCZV_05055, partial [Sediminibacterium sp.]